MLKGLLAGKPLVAQKWGENKQPDWKFVLGKMQYNGTLIPFPESASLQKGNKILLFLNKEKLLDYLAKKQKNDDHFKRERKKGVDELRIAETLPFPNLFHIDVWACAEIDDQKIQRLIEERRKQIVESCDTLPEKPVFIPYERHFGDYVAVLEVDTT